MNLPSRLVRRISLAAALLVTGGTASAQEERRFAEKGQFVLGVDRLMPILAYESVRSSQGNAGSTLSAVSFSLVGHGRTVTLYNQPRFSFDFLVTSGLTLGGSAYVFTQASNTLTIVAADGQTTTVDGAKETLWGIAPRVGYAIPLGHSVAFWPRGGFSFNEGTHGAIQVGTTTVTGNTFTQFAIDVEPTLVFTPISHVGITVSAVVDIPVTGSLDAPSTTTPNVTASYEIAELHVGANAGLLVYF